MSQHPTWCARGHQCNLGEHRGEILAQDVPGIGRVVLTRVQDVNGRQLVELRTRMPLGPTEPRARFRLGQLLAWVAQLAGELPDAGLLGADVRDGGLV
jgi:hypothetical protein